MSALTTSRAPALWEIEEDLLALIETEDLVQPEQEESFRQELEHQLQTAVEKRERCGQFLRFLALQADNCETEIKRLQERRKRYQNTSQRMREYITHAIECLGQDQKGKWRKLEGRTITFSLRNSPVSLEISDPALVPSEHSDIEISLPLLLWQRLTAAATESDANAVRSAESRARFLPNKPRIRAALERGEEVPGCDLQLGVSLVVK